VEEPEAAPAVEEAHDDLGVPAAHGQEAGGGQDLGGMIAPIAGEGQGEEVRDALGAGVTLEGAVPVTGVKGASEDEVEGHTVSFRDGCGFVPKESIGRESAQNGHWRRGKRQGGSERKGIWDLKTGDIGEGAFEGGRRRTSPAARVCLR